MNKIELIDTHAHVYDEKYDDDRDVIIKKSVELGVRKIYMPNINSTTIKNSIDVASAYPQNCFPMIGLHPCDIKENYIDELNKIKKYFTTTKFYGIGEIGIDLYWEKKYLTQQIDAFNIQLNWAEKYDLPIIIHSRNAFNETITTLKKFYNGKKIRGIFHCFGGSLEDAKEIIDLGLFLGIGGIVTFQNSGLAEVIKEIDLKHIVLETDSPYLAPTPFRGKRNEPSFLLNIAEEIATIKQKYLDEVAKLTTFNANKIFGANIL